MGRRYIKNLYIFDLRDDCEEIDSYRLQEQQVVEKVIQPLSINYIEENEKLIISECSYFKVTGEQVFLKRDDILINSYFEAMNLYFFQEYNLNEKSCAKMDHKCYKAYKAIEAITALNILYEKIYIFVALLNYTYRFRLSYNLSSRNIDCDELIASIINGEKINKEYFDENVIGILMMEFDEDFSNKKSSQERIWNRINKMIFKFNDLYLDFVKYVKRNNL